MEDLGFVVRHDGVIKRNTEGFEVEVQAASGDETHGGGWQRLVLETSPIVAPFTEFTLYDK